MDAHATPPVDYKDVPSQSFDTLEDDLGWLLTRLTSAGIEEVVTVDLTNPAFGIPVHRVILPGLEGPHDHDDYCPGARARKRFAA